MHSAAPDYHPPQTPWLDILYQDEWLVALNKPAGLLSVPGKDPALYDSIAWRAKSLSPYAEVVHRLDMDTSGLLLIALRKQSERALKQAFEQRQIKKTYLARVWGQLPQPQGQINLPLSADWPNRPKQKVCFEQGKASVTEYICLDQDEHTSWVRLYPLTGRSHQLRVHLLALGCPILGDRFYAHEQALAASDRLLLHAESLRLVHPVTGVPLSLMAPCPFA